MAWPCISRVCCLARFWNQFDKSDLSVPLTIQNYSDIAEQEVRSVTKQVPGNNYSTPDQRAAGVPHASKDGPGTQGSFRGRREPSYKPREDYHPPEMPFTSVTQYKQDYKPWPIPRKDNFPWISNGGSRADSGSDSPVNSSHSQAGPGDREERVRGQRFGEQQVMEESKTSSYRQEYRPWTGSRPAKSARRDPSAQYTSPGTEANQVLRETSYQAAYSGEGQRSIGLHQVDNDITSAASNIQPAAVPQPIPTAMQAGRSPIPSSLQQSVPPERSEFSRTINGEEHLVRTKYPPNPSAIFQSGPRVFNI
ncbi:microtubule-associated protein 6 homolog [Anoplopoma fimbria]|uniref:microtubule-associated protein 6 homolog n=1 Tax=Anoplopoma fimbria TaxID=229290 RepID=UPI0023EB6711|nr:microtubule-associated protein 6 homolog [Anoplopoma fimbria]